MCGHKQTSIMGHVQQCDDCKMHRLVDKALQPIGPWVFDTDEPEAFETDKRIAYGAICTWWNTIDKVGTHSTSGLPCCPVCQGMLMEMESEEIWNNGVSRYMRESGDAQYADFNKWLRGKCFADSGGREGAREQFDATHVN